MKLTQSRKKLIVEKFKSGESIATIASWTEQPVKRVEIVIRERLYFSEYRLDGANSLLAHAAPAVDHSCLADKTLGDHDCKRCAIDAMVEQTK